MSSRTIDLGVRVHTLDEGSGDTTFVLVHGLGGSHANWSPLVAPLARRGRVLVPDLAGFGRTPVGANGASVDANLALLARFVETAASGPVVLVGNSMGALLSLRMAAQHASRVRAVVLLDPAAPIPFGARVDPAVAAMFASYLVPGVAGVMMRRRSARVGPEGMVRDLLKLCAADLGRIDPTVIEEHVALARERASFPWAVDAFLEAARSVVMAVAQRGAYHAAVDAVRAPTLLVHGARDRLVPVDAARALARRRADWRYVERSDLGHVPQLEDPRWLLGEMEPWLDAL